MKSGGVGGIHRKRSSMAETVGASAHSFGVNADSGSSQLDAPQQGFVRGAASKSARGFQLFL